MSLEGISQVLPLHQVFASVKVSGPKPGASPHDLPGSQEGRRRKRRLHGVLLGPANIYEGKVAISVVISPCPTNTEYCSMLYRKAH